MPSTGFVPKTNDELDSDAYDDEVMDDEAAADEEAVDDAPGDEDEEEDEYEEDEEEEEAVAPAPAPAPRKAAPAPVAPAAASTELVSTPNTAALKGLHPDVRKSAIDLHRKLQSIEGNQLQTMWEVGRNLLKYQLDKTTYGEKCIDQMANFVGVKAQRLYRAIKVAKQFPDLSRVQQIAAKSKPGYTLSFSVLEELTGVRDDKDREQALIGACREGLAQRDVRQLKRKKQIAIAERTLSAQTLCSRLNGLLDKAITESKKLMKGIVKSDLTVDSDEASKRLANTLFLIDKSGGEFGRLLTRFSSDTTKLIKGIRVSAKADEDEKPVKRVIKKKVVKKTAKRTIKRRGARSLRPR